MRRNGGYAPAPALELLNKLLRYDPETGHLYNRVARGGLRVGDICGKRAGPCVIVTVGNRQYYAHRLIWYIQTGYDPINHTVDHVDRDGRNNRWPNLRLATAVEQIRNQGVRADNRLKVKGVNYFRGRYRATINTGGKQRYLGSFATVEEASTAYQEAARTLHGEFYAAAK